MKNKAIKITNTESKDFGKWAITNKKGTYLTSYVYNTEEEAIERSMVKNISDLHIKMDDEFDKLVKKYPKQYSHGYEGNKCNLSDLLA